MRSSDKMEIQPQPEPTHEELLKEAQAWGFETVEEFFDMLDEEYKKFEEENQ